VGVASAVAEDCIWPCWKEETTWLVLRRTSDCNNTMRNGSTSGMVEQAVSVELACHEK